MVFSIPRLLIHIALASCSLVVLCPAAAAAPTPNTAALMPGSLSVSDEGGFLLEGADAAAETQKESDISAALAAYYEGERLRKQELVEVLPQAIEKLDEALRLSERANDVHWIAMSLNELGLCYSRTGDIDKAMGYFQRSLERFRADGDGRNEGAVLTNIADVHQQLSEYDQAISLLQRARTLRQDPLNGRGVAFVLQRLGVVYSELGENEKAIKIYEEALPLWKAARDDEGEGATYNNIGFAYYLRGLKHEALSYYERALSILTEKGFKRASVYVRNNMARVYNDWGRTDLALSSYEKALPLSRSVGDAKIEAIILSNYATVYINTKEASKALPFLTQALTIQRRIGHKAGEGRTLGLLLSAWGDLGKPRLAIFYGKQAVNRFQEIRQNIRLLDKDLQKRFLSSRQDVYRELAELLITKGRLPEAQQVLDMLKEDEYFEFTRRDIQEGSALTIHSELNAQEQEAEKTLKEFGDELAAQAKEYGELRAKANRTPDEIKRLNELFDILSGANQRFQQLLDRLAAEFGNTDDARDRLFNIRENQSLMETLKVLGRNTAVLYTIVLEDKYRVILITPDVQIPREYPIASAELSRKVYAFLSTLRDPNQDPTPRAKELYKILVGPVLNDLKGAGAETLMWSLDDVLRYVPVAALHDGNDYLVKSYKNVVYTPASRDNLREPHVDDWRGLGFGLSKAQPLADDLPYVTQELEGIIQQDGDVSQVPGVVPGRRLLNDDFTFESLRENLLPGGHQLVHIASHFKFKTGDELGSYLLLGKGRKLTVLEIKGLPNLFSGVDLLTLSACNTAMSGGSPNGKEVEGFAVLAQRQGAHSVIASLWPVVDPSTGALMLKFYQVRNSARGVSKAEALQKAQLALLDGELKAADTGKSYAHPYFWAPFILIGNWK